MSVRVPVALAVLDRARNVTKADVEAQAQFSIPVEPAGGPMTEASPTLDALSALEKAAVLDRLVTDDPGLRASAERIAVNVLSDDQRDQVADEVVRLLRGLHMFELDGRAGYQPNRGYVHETDAAHEILDEAMDPYLSDLERRARLGLTSTAVELAVGILAGLHRCRNGGPELLLEYAPDYARETADLVLDRCRKLDLTLPTADLGELVPEWNSLVT